MTKAETQAVLQNMVGIYQLIAQILYGSGLRLNEALKLRVKDVDFAQQQIIDRNAKEWESRVTMLPSTVIVLLQEHLPGTPKSLAIAARGAVSFNLNASNLAQKMDASSNGDDCRIDEHKHRKTHSRIGRSDR